MHLKLTNDIPEKYSIGQLRRDNSQTSFAKTIPDSTLAEYGVYPYTQPTPPDYENLTEHLVEGDFEQDENGNWILPFVVEQLSLEKAGSNVRSIRDNLISTEIDTVNPMRWNAMTELQQQNWSDYRQALLDVPQQPGFPYSVEWPTKPE